MAKKYMQIRNLADFKSYGVERYQTEINGRALRVYCHCGRVDTEFHEVCPDCGCNTVTTSYNKRNYYKLDTLSSPPTVIDITEWVGVDIESDDMVALKLRSTSHSYELSHSSKASQIIKDHPELLTMRNYHLFNETKTLVARHLKDSEDGIASWAIAILDKIYRDPRAPRTMDYIYQIFNTFCNKAVYGKLSTIVTSNQPISHIMSQLSKAHPFVLKACKDASSYNNAIHSPTRFNNMNEDLLLFISSYAAEGYISEPWRFMERAELLIDDDDARRLFIKFVKEKYASFDWYLGEVETIINYLNTGKDFTNVKDYYLWKNSEAISGGYSPVAVADALADVYTNPTEAIFNLANLK